MKTLLLMGLALSLSAFAQTNSGQGSGYAPNNGTAQPGNPGTFTTPNTGLGNAATPGTGTDVNGAGTMGSGSSASNTGSDAGTTMQSGNADPNTQANENLERSNTSANPIPSDTTLQTGKTQTGPYKTPGNKQSQESDEEELDYRALEGVDHDEQNASGNQ